MGPLVQDRFEGSGSRQKKKRARTAQAFVNPGLQVFSTVCLGKVFALLTCYCRT